MSYKVKLNEWLESDFVSEEFKTELRSIEDEKNWRTVSIQSLNSAPLA